MNGTAQCITIELTVPKGQVAKIRRIADRMRFEAGILSFEELKAVDRMRCCKCGEIKIDGTQLDIGYICKECLDVPT